MDCPVCGGKLEGPHVRFHYAEPFIDEITRGHYVNEGHPLTPEPGLSISIPGASPPLTLDLQLPPVRERGENRALFRGRAWAWMTARASDSRQVAPPPGEQPPKPWLTEDTARWALIKLMETLGYSAHNLEQGHRPDGGHTRVSKGLPDVYFHGRGYRGWIETKRWDNDQTPEQTAFMVEELENNGIYLLIYEPEQFVRWHQQPPWRNV